MEDPALRPEPRVPASSRQWLTVVAAIVAVVAGALVVLNLGGEGETERAGDLTYFEGTAPRHAGGAELAASTADVLTAEVASGDGNEIVFSADLAARLRESSGRSALELRWDLAPEEGPDWTLAVAVGKGAEVTLLSEDGYGAGTVDDTLPGELTIHGPRVEVHLDAGAVEGFPEEFGWSLSTTLRAFRTDPRSPRVQDRYPDAGEERFPG